MNYLRTVFRADTQRLYTRRWFFAPNDIAMETFASGGSWLHNQLSQPSLLKKNALKDDELVHESFLYAIDPAVDIPVKVITEIVVHALCVIGIQVSNCYSIPYPRSLTAIRLPSSVSM